MTDKATLIFPTREMATEFSRDWTRFTLEGCDMSATREDGTVKLELYNVNEERKQWLEKKISEMSEK